MAIKVSSSKEKHQIFAKTASNFAWKMWQERARLQSTICFFQQIQSPLFGEHAQKTIIMSCPMENARKA